MFYDLVGSTTVASRLDPEDLRDVIGAFHRCVREEVTRIGGFVARYLGDGGLIYFGYPEAHEDDAERAMHAGLRAIEAVSRLTLLAGYKPEIRIGVATGLVVVGDIVGVGSLPEQDIVGQTPNLAARLQSIADPGTMVIADTTQRVAGRLFEYLELGPLVLKGFAEPVRAWRVLGTGRAETRFEAQRETGFTSLVGRQDELEQLMDSWRSARSGRGQIVALSGEAGIGKSRIAAMFLTRLAADSHTRLRYFCSQHHRGSPFYPSIKQLERAAAFSRGDSPDDKLKKLETALIPGARFDETVSLIADLLSVPVNDRYPKLPANPGWRRERTMEALLLQLELLSRQHPVVAVFEDAHWIDPTSLELLNRTVERIRGLPVLVIVTFRPEFQPSWRGPHTTSITLVPLSQRESVTLVEKVAGEDGLPQHLVDEIVERADGVPLFLEELTKAVLEVGADSKAEDRALAQTPPRRAAVPATLHASLMARLDRLGPAKEVAQIGAAIGREFSCELLAIVSGYDPSQLSLALERLQQAGLAAPQRTGASPNFLFKHALVQDAAYSTLLRATRRQLHERITHALEDNFPETVLTQPEVMAHHCTEAGLTEKATAYWLKAGQQALARSAMVEATARLLLGLDLLAKLPESVWRYESELQFQIALGKALIASKGHAAPVTGEAFARARELCEQLGRPPQFVSVLHGQWTHSLLRADLGVARQRAKELLESGEVKGDPVWILMGCRSSGVSCFPLGQFREARSYLDRGLKLFDPAQRPLYAGLTVDDVQVVMMYYSSWAVLYLGDVDQARARCDSAMNIARHLRQAYSLAHVLIASCLIEIILQSYATALNPLEEIQALAKEHGISYFGAIGTIFRGRCLAALGREREGIDLLTRGISALRESGNVLYLPTFLTFLADAYRRAAQYDLGLKQIEEAVQIVETTQTHCDETEMYRVQGELLCAAGEPVRGEESFRDAIAVAQRQDARLWELRAAVSLAQFLRDRNRSAEARELLIPRYVAFTEGMDTVPITQARELLNTLE